MTSLFSAKSIVLVCSFSFIIMFYFIGGFDVLFTLELPNLTLPEIRNPFENNDSIGKINTNPEMSEKCQKAYNLGPNSWYFENCPNQSLRSMLVESAESNIVCDYRCNDARKYVSNISDCEELINLWSTNTAWGIRNEIALKILNSCSVT